MHLQREPQAPAAQCGPVDWARAMYSDGVGRSAPHHKLGTPAFLPKILLPDSVSFTTVHALQNQLHFLSSLTFCSHYILFPEHRKFDALGLLYKMAKTKLAQVSFLPMLY